MITPENWTHISLLNMIKSFSRMSFLTGKHQNKIQDKDICYLLFKSSIIEICHKLEIEENLLFKAMWLYT